jgi:hypothetical protein
VKKIYVHHPFTESLFEILFHNTTDKEWSISDDKTGYVNLKYNSQRYHIEFTKEIHDNADGKHILSFYELYRSMIHKTDERVSDINQHRSIIIDIKNVLRRMDEWIGDKKDWWVDIIFGESFHEFNDSDVNTILKSWTNHTLLTELLYFNNSIPNNLFLLTQTLMFWNKKTNLMVYRDYGKLHKMINHPYPLGFQIKRHRRRRLKIGRLLAKTNTYVSQTRWVDEIIKHPDSYFKPIDGAHINELIGKSEFENRFLSYMVADRVGMDIFFLLYPKARIQILDETQSSDVYKTTNRINILFLSEKTWGMLIGNIGFIPTHTFVLDFISKKICDKPYPFYDEIKYVESDSYKLVEWICQVGNDEDKIQQIESWVTEIHETLIHNILNENSLLDNIEYKQEKNKLL